MKTQEPEYIEISLDQYEEMINEHMLNEIALRKSLAMMEGAMKQIINLQKENKDLKKTIAGLTNKTWVREF